MEQGFSVDHTIGEYAEMEEDARARHSECMSLSVIHLHEKLAQLQFGRNASASLVEPDGAALTVACLPPEVVDMVLLYVTQAEAEIKQAESSAEELDAQTAATQGKTESLKEKIERLKSSVAAMSAKSSAEMNSFREVLRQNADASKQRQRDQIDLVRKREKLESELKRTEIEIERLRKISKRVK